MGRNVSNRAAPRREYMPPHLVAEIARSAAALEGERKHVTILFADLKASMEQRAGRDPEDARRRLGDVLALMMDAVHAFEGTVNQASTATA